MAGYSSSNKPKDTNVQRPVGEYVISITEVEMKPSKGTEYLALKCEGKNKDGVESTFYINFFPNSTADFPKQMLENFLTITGFYINGSINIDDFQQLKGKQFVGVTQYVESEYNGDINTRLEVNSFFNLQYKSAGEVADNKEAKNFKSSIDYVTKNPLKALKKASESETDLPF